MSEVVLATPPAVELDVVERRHVSTWQNARAALLGFVSVGLLAAFEGGYWPSSWGWAGLVLAWLAVATVVVSDVRLGLLDVLILGAFAGLLLWIALSAVWSDSLTATAREIERTAVYVAGLAAALTVVRARAYGALLAGLWAAVTLAALYGLATRLVPDRLGVFDAVANYRLSEPIGYWNGLGAFVAMGILLAVGFAARSRGLPMRGAAAASLVVLVPTLYFTFSRGGWLALGLGLICALALDPRRLQLLLTLFVLAPWPAAGVWVASRSDSLTHLRASLGGAADDGRRVALVLAVLAVAATAAGIGLGIAERRYQIPRRVRRGGSIALGVTLLVLLVGVFAVYGSPPTLVERGYDAFAATPRPVGNDLNRRLFDLSGSGRLEQWRVAWRDARDHPVLGSGAGTYEQYWIRDRPIPGKVRDAHNLYIEMLAEVGPAGVAFLALALGVPVLAAVRARRRRLVPFAFGAYVVLLAHAAVDWDWELPAVTLLAVLCAAALLLAARLERGPPVLSLSGRTALASMSVLLALVAGVGLIGNSALDRMADKLEDGDASAARAQAEKAERWAPWSSEPLYWLGYLDQVQGDRTGARGHYRDAVDRDPNVWELWLTLAQVSRGEERRHALERAAELNPLGAALPSRLRQERRDASS